MLSGLHYNHIEVIRGGSVYPVKQGKQTMGLAFYYKVGEADKKRKVVTGNSEEELKEKAIAFLNKLDNECDMAIMATKIAMEEVMKPKQLTFREVGDLWFTEYSQKRNDKKKPISYASVESRQYSLKRINEVIGDMLIADITQDVAEDTIDRCSIKKNGTYYSESAVNKLQQVFLLIMEFGRKKGYCSQVIEKVDLSDELGKVDTDARFLDREQLSLVVGILNNNPRYRVLVKLLIATGLRQEEALALNVNDFKVKKDNGNIVEITIDKTDVEVAPHEYKIVNRTKTDNSKRKVYIPISLYEEIMEYYNSVVDNESVYECYMRQLNETEGLIFADKTQKVMNKRTFNRSLINYIQRNGGDKLGFKVSLHMIRHSYASFQAESRPAIEVAKLLGDTLKTVEDNYYSMSKNVIEEVTNNSADILDSIVNYDF